MRRSTKMLPRSYCTGQAIWYRSALAARSGQYGSASRARPSTTTSARPLAKISSAISGLWISPSAPVAMPARLRIASANGT